MSELEDASRAWAGQFSQQQERLRDLERQLAEAQEKIEEVRTQAAGALEIAANDLEALDAGIEVTERGGRAPWSLARRAINAILGEKGA